MNIKYELYKTFYVVANCQTITEAAKKLMISQPAVTKSIKCLEQQLNGCLFIRSKSGIKLTEDGKNFYNFIRPAIEQINDAEKIFTNISKLDKGDIKIGASNTILKYFLIYRLKTFSKSFPKINISIEENYTPNLINMVKNGNLDIAIIYANENDTKLEGLKLYYLNKLNYCLIGNKQYEKFTSKPISFDQLKGENLILNTTNPIHASFIKKEDYNYADYNAHINLASHSLVYEFVKQGFGLGVLIKEFIKEDLESKDLYEIMLKEKFQSLNLIMIINKTNFPTYATSQLIDIIYKSIEKDKQV